MQGESDEASNLLKLWGLLDADDLWYELVASAVRPDVSTEPPGWLRRIAENELEYWEAMQLLSRFSLVDARDDKSGHSMHSVLHAWCGHLSAGEERRGLLLIVTEMVASMVPSEETSEYWKLQRRLLPHGSYVYRLIRGSRLEWFSWDTGIVKQSWMFYNLGLLFSSIESIKENRFYS